MSVAARRNCSASRRLLEADSSAASGSLLLCSEVLFGCPRLLIWRLESEPLRQCWLWECFPCKCCSTSSRSSPTSSLNSAVRPGASPSQKGRVGGAPSASVTRTMPRSTLRMRHEWVPSRKMSPAMDSTAQSSCTVPMKVSSGSSTTL